MRSGKSMELGWVRGYASLAFFLRKIEEEKERLKEEEVEGGREEK